MNSLFIAQLWCFGRSGDKVSLIWTFRERTVASTQLLETFQIKLRFAMPPLYVYLIALHEKERFFMEQPEQNYSSKEPENSQLYEKHPEVIQNILFL